ncbi:MAG: transglutaminase-like domain-containing protein [Planctomycetota bacterium]|nr:transglutaminase-like domain-containing protein [Planctomycetota bacterium]
MPFNAPRHCRPEAYALLASQLEVIDTTAGLVRAAVAIAQHEHPLADADTVNVELDRIADLIRQRVRRPDLDALLAHAHQVLFEEEGFAGNMENYYDRGNSYLPLVLETRRGLPIMLAMVYKAVLERLGLRVVGINAPVHFLAGVVLAPPVDDDDADPSDAPPFGFAAGASSNPPRSDADEAHGKAEGQAEREMMLVDPFFGGRVLSRREALEQIEGVTGPIDPSRALARATHRQWLVRMTHNLEAIFARDDRYADVSAMIEMRKLLGAPEA